MGSTRPSSQSDAGSGAGSGAAGQGESSDREYWIGIGRGFGGSILFAIPLLMTMEMWWLGFYMPRLRLALLLVLMIPMLMGLAYLAGLKPTMNLLDVTLDAMTAYGIALVASTVVLWIFDVIDFTAMPPREVVGKIALEAVPASFGAMLAQSQLGGGGGARQQRKERKQRSGYRGELFLMSAGALYLAFTVAPTVEMIKIPFRMNHWHALALALLSIAIMHAFVYVLQFRGAPETPEGTPWWSLLVRYTMPGYVIALLVAGYLMWSFDRFESDAPQWMLMYAITLGFPAAVGAAAGRLVI